MTPLILAAAFGATSVAPQKLPDSEDVRDVPAQAYYVNGDERKEYVVIGKVGTSPKRVCLVMPGGDGSIDFHLFIKRILKNGLGNGWLVVELVAPKWSTSGDRVVWPSASIPDKNAKFTIEEFLDGVLDELPKRQKIKIGSTYMLGWSSSGPAIYSYASHGKHSIDGAFVAMSIFNKEFLGDSKKLKIAKFYLLHSPQDFIPMSNPEAAKSALGGLGIPVKLDTYQGGHGWAGPVYNEIFDGFSYLATKT